MNKLSIITINYNNANGLETTIKSIIKQGFIDYEYLIIDGGSNDRSLEIISNYEQYISYWVSEPDGGIYHAMNKGIIKSNGEYLIFLNSGDWLCNDHVLNNIFKNPTDSDLIFGNMIKILKNGKLNRVSGTLEKEITLLSFFHETICHPSSFIKRSLFFKFGLYDENLKIVSDWKFYLVVFGLNNSSIKYENIDISFYNTEGISSNQTELAQNERDIVLKELLPYRVNLYFQNNRKYLVNLEKIKTKNLPLLVYRFTQNILVKLTKLILLVQSK